MLRVTVIVCGVLLGLLLATILMAINHSSVLEGLDRVLADPWGIVTLLDLSVGLMFVAAWITIIEPRPLLAAIWIVALFALGNVITLVFLLWRTRYVTRFSELFLPSRRSAQPEP